MDLRDAWRRLRSLPFLSDSIVTCMFSTRVNTTGTISQILNLIEQQPTSSSKIKREQLVNLSLKLTTHFLGIAIIIVVTRKQKLERGLIYYCTMEEEQQHNNNNACRVQHRIVLSPVGQQVVSLLATSQSSMEDPLPSYVDGTFI